MRSASSSLGGAAARSLRAGAGVTARRRRMTTITRPTLATRDVDQPAEPARRGLGQDPIAVLRHVDIEDLLGGLALREQRTDGLLDVVGRRRLVQRDLLGPAAGRHQLRLELFGFALEGLRIGRHDGQPQPERHLHQHAHAVVPSGSPGSGANRSPGANFEFTARTASTPARLRGGPV